MDQNDRQAIESLFTKLSSVEQQAGPRDPDADRFIKDQVASQPGAPYFMAQTIVVQEQALAAAQQRIEQLEGQGTQAQPQERGGLLSGLFGGGATAASGARQPSSVPSTGRPSPWGQQAPADAMQRRGGGGGFLAGAAQTAMGVAGGMLLGNAIAGMFGGNEANAAEPAADAAPADEPAADDMDMGGDDMGDFEL